MHAIDQFIENFQLESLQMQWQAPWFTLSINRLQQKNALNRELVQTLLNTLSFVEAQQEIRGLIITGQAGIFCAGADIQEMAKVRQGGTLALADNNQLYGQMIHRLHLCRVPTFALVDGPALGGGMGLVCATDFILCTEKALFGMPEPKIGVIAGQIMPHVLRKLGLVKTQNMSLQGLNISGKQAFEWGFINEYFADIQAMQQGLKKYLQNISQCAPGALSNTKALINTATQVSATDIKALAHQVAHASMSAEGIEGGMAFLQKRQPQWSQK